MTTMGSDGPMVLTKASAKRKLGTIWKASVMRISASSMMPPAKPASVPMTVPIRRAAAAAQRPTSSELRAAWNRQARTSRPSVSVPSGRARSVNGGISGAATMESGSLGKTKGAERPAAATTKRIARPTRPSRLRNTWPRTVTPFPPRRRYADREARRPSRRSG